MKKVLLVTTVSGFVPQFELENVRLLQAMGYEVHYAADFRTPHYGADNRRLKQTKIIPHQVDFVRSPYQIRQNLHAYYQLKRLLQQESYELLHCHTPMGSVLARLAVHRINRKEKRIYVIYTAHGFHFYRGAPWINWLLYYPMERWLMRDTDLLITLNEEDAKRAKRFCRKKRTKVEQVDGVGIDLSYWTMKEKTVQEKQKIRSQMRASLKIPDQATVYLSVGELSKRKNHQVVIAAFSKLKKAGRLPTQTRYLIAGEGVLEPSLKQQIERAGLQQQILLLGYREDIRNLLCAADVFLFPSRQEGMPVALLEAAAFGLFLIAQEIRGNREIVQHAGGMLIQRKSPSAWMLGLQVGERQKRQRDRRKSSESVSTEYRLQQYGTSVIRQKMQQIYQKAMQSMEIERRKKIN